MAKRVGYRCSNPSCKKPTCGASDDPNNYSNIGVAAHICSAARGGKRYNPDMSKEERRDIHNVKQEQSCFKLLLLQYQTLSCVLMDGFPKTTAGSGSRYNSGSVIRKTQKKHTLFAVPAQFLRVRFFFDHQIKVILYLGRIFIIKRNSFS